MSRLRDRTFRILSPADRSQALGRLVDAALIALIGANMLAVVLASIPSVEQRFGHLLELFTRFSIGLFSIEYLARLWSSTSHRSVRFRQPVVGRLRFALTPLMLTDLAVLVPFYAGLGAVLDLRMLRVFRLLSILHFSRISPAFEVLAHVVRREARTLFAIAMLTLALLLVASSLMHYIEGDVQPETFGSIPHAMWWGMATLTTVGFGDVVPVTGLGKFVGGLVMFVGVGMYAIPTGVLVTAFAQELKRKDFVATWQLVAQVPAFSDLNAVEIANITDLLHLHTAMPGEVLFRKGDPADNMYFIVSGEVEVQDEVRTRSLHGGDFFGELSILYHYPRTATVTAKTVVELLQLDAADLETLLESNQALREQITATAQERAERILKAQTNSP